MQTKSAEILKVMTALQNEEDSRILSWFFKTGKGEYGYGDKFLGIRVPQVRQVVRQFKGSVSFEEMEKLLYSKWHEVRLCGFLLLEQEMKHKEKREQVAEFYLRHAKQANNWDLVDLSAWEILGTWLLEKNKSSRKILDKLAASDNLWEQRISIVATYAFIRVGQLDDTLRIATKLLSHPHDLIHKAVGWMLREAGKRDLNVLRRYLEEHYAQLPRTTLRYAIEKMDVGERKQWLKGVPKNSR